MARQFNVCFSGMTSGFTLLKSFCTDTKLSKEATFKARSLNMEIRKRYRSFIRVLLSLFRRLLNSDTNVV